MCYVIQWSVNTVLPICIVQTVPKSKAQHVDHNSTVCNPNTVIRPNLIETDYYLYGESYVRN